MFHFAKLLPNCKRRDNTGKPSRHFNTQKTTLKWDYSHSKFHSTNTFIASSTFATDCSRSQFRKGVLNYTSDISAEYAVLPSFHTQSFLQPCPFFKFIFSSSSSQSTNHKLDAMRINRISNLNTFHLLSLEDDQEHATVTQNHFTTSQMSCCITSSVSCPLALPWRWV